MSEAARRPRILTISTMFPSVGLPRFGVFVRHRMRHVASRSELRLVSGVPVFPPVTGMLGRYRDRLAIPDREIHGDGPTAIDARYPHFLSVPMVLKPLDGPSLALAVMRQMRQLASEGFRPDILDAHLAYPDGFAAVWLGRRYGLPVSITVRGHDVNDMSQHPVRWAQSRWALRNADRVLGVCQALIDAAVEAGAPADRSRAVPNGVDPDLFFSARDAGEPARLREALDLPVDRRIVLSVGHMIERKGFHILIEAIARMDAEHRPLLVLVGGRGEESDYRPVLDQLVADLGVDRDVHFAGPVENTDLRDWYVAADISALASSREGWANVLFESIACGRPVIATEVWGTPECICRPEYGILVGERSGEAFAAALETALWKRQWDETELVAYAADNTWDQVGARHLAQLEQALRDHESAVR